MMKSLYKFTSVFIFAIVFLFFGCNLGFDTAYYMQANRDDVSEDEVGIIEDGETEPEDFGDDEEGNGDVAEETEEVTNADGSVTTKKTTTKTVTNPDGSTSVIVTLVETTTYPDGSRDVTTTITETKTPGDFNPFYNGEWNDPNYKFPASTVDNFFLKVVFGSGNIPAYQFYKGGSFKNGSYTVTNTPIGGKPSTSKVNTKYYNPPNGENKVTDPMNVNIENAEFHRFDGRNPLRRPASKAEQTNTERFRFWHFKGKASVQNLDQYLCVVDTHSKFIWAYVKITGTSTTAGQAVPVQFDALENYGDKRMFWEYDPIGYVDANGNVTLYNEYTNDMRSQTAVNFFPKIHNANRGVATQNGAGGAGRSPYYWANVPDWFEKGEVEVTVKGPTTVHYAPGEEIDSGSDDADGDGDDETTIESKFLNALSAAGGYFKSRPKIEYKYRKRDGNLEYRVGYDTNLIEWELPFDEPQLVYSVTDEKIGDSSKKTEVYKFVKDNDENGTSATFKDNTGTEVVFSLNGTSLLKGGQTVGASDFADPGADFILRVRDTKFVKVVTVDRVRKVVKYEFSEDGGSVTTKNMTGTSVGGSFTGDGTYYFVQEVDGNKKRAIYQLFDTVAFYRNPYYGLELIDGYKQIQRTRASSDLNAWSENLGTVGAGWEWIVGKFSSPSEIGVRTAESVADAGGIALSDFLELAADLTFKNRPQVSYTYSKDAMNIGSAKGDGFELHEYKFSDDGKTLTLTKTDWETNNKRYKVYNVVENQTMTSVTSAKYEWKSPSTLLAEDEEVTVGYDYEKGNLTFNGATVAYDVFTDRGPAFVLRVRGKAYKDRDRDRYYWFDDYGTLTDSENNRKYYFVQEDSSTRAVFLQEGAAVLKYYGIRLTCDASDADNSASNLGTTLYWTDGDGWASPGTTPTKTAGTFVSHLSTNFIDYVKGKSFAYTSGGVEYKWTFDSDGKMATKYQNGTKVRELEWIKSDGGSGKYGPSNNPVTFTRMKQANGMCIRAVNNGEQANYYPK